MKRSPTLSLFLDDYFAEAGKRLKPVSCGKIHELYVRCIGPRFGALRLDKITTRAIAEWHGEMKETSTQANRALAALSAVLSQAVRWSLIDRNPCHGVRSFPESGRERYLTPEELAQVIVQFDAHRETHPLEVAFLTLLLYTGARPGELQKARWDWIQGRVIALPDAKRGPRRIYLPVSALLILAELPRTGPLICPITYPRRLWERIRTAAGCPDVRIYDLRHTFASAALASGQELALIGELLGHRKAQTTKRYAHLMTAAGEDAAEKAAAFLNGMMAPGLNT
mgnify:CR=1 FL=1